MFISTTPTYLCGLSVIYLAHTDSRITYKRSGNEKYHITPDQDLCGVVVGRGSQSRRGR